MTLTNQSFTDEKKAIISRPSFSREEARMLSGLQLAYIGDTVYDLLIRQSLLMHDSRVKDMHKAAVQRVNAVAQARTLTQLLPFLTEEETDIVRRGRNAHPHHTAPKAASTGDYAMATGLEALIGFLYLTGEDDRLYHLFAISEDNASCPKQS